MHHGRNGFLTAKGLVEAAQRELGFSGGVDMGATRCYLDKVVSVSGLVEVEGLYVHDDDYIDEQYWRAANGS